MNFSRQIISRGFNTLKHSTSFNLLTKQYNQAILQTPFLRSIQTTIPKNDLMEFFDVKENWGQNEVKVGRSWNLEELRIKSNSDLHKLWFVLLKERNMLLTMEHEAKDQIKLFPNPERIEKIEMSMENLETIVRERNRAYYELETGETGERSYIPIKNQLGLDDVHELKEYDIPKSQNEEWKKDHEHSPPKGREYKNLLNLYKEKLMIKERKQKNRDFNHVVGLLKRFPKMNMENLKSQFPDVNIERAVHSKKAIGNYNKSTE